MEQPLTTPIPAPSEFICMNTKTVVYKPPMVPFEI